MQSVSSRIWTRVAVSISYDDNHDTTGTSLDSNSLPFVILNNTVLSNFKFVYMFSLQVLNYVI